MQDLRSFVFVSFGFLLMGRSDTDAQLALNDVSVDDTSITVRLRAEKGKKRHATRRVLTFPTAKLHGMVAVLRRWLSLHEYMGTSPSAPGSFWRLPSDPVVFASSSDVCTQWLLRACSWLNFSPPKGFKWTSHSLRKGAASAASALLVPLNTICFIGGWSIKSSVVHDYIDPTVAPTPAGRVFFGWC